MQHVARLNFSILSGDAACRLVIGVAAKGGMAQVGPVSFPSHL